MTFQLADRVEETTLTTGTGTLTLAGAIYAHQSFASGLVSGSTCDYSIVDPVTGAWEVGIGTFTAPSTLSRDSVLSSSNSNALVSFAAGTKYVSVVAAASYIAGLDNSTAVILTPTTAVRNVVQATGDIPGLVVKAAAAQSAANMLEVKDSAGNNYWVIGPAGTISYGVTPDSRFLFFIGPTVVPTGAEVYQGVRSNIKVQPTTNTTASATGSLHNPESGGTGNISTLIAVEGDVNHKGSGAVTTIAGLITSATTNGAGGVTTLSGVNSTVGPSSSSTGASVIVTAYAGYFKVGALAGAGLITNAYGVYVAIGTGGSGVVTNSYGVYIESVTNGGTLNYALYTNSGIVRLGGNLLLNSGILYPGADGTTAIRIMKADAATAVFTVDTTNSVVIAPKVKLSSGVIFPSSDGTTAILLAKADGTTAVLTVDTTNSIVTVPKLKLSSSVIFPSSDSTTAVQIDKADGTTAVLTVDTTNSRVGIGITPTVKFHVSGGSMILVNAGAVSLTINDSSNGNIPTIDFQQNTTSKCKIEAGVGLGSNMYLGAAGNRLLALNASGLSGINIWSVDAITNTVANSLIVGHNNSGGVGTPSVTNYGTAIKIQGQDSTTADVDMARLRTFWTTATHASRVANAILSVYDTAERDAITLIATGSAAQIQITGKAQVKEGLSASGFAALGGSVFDHFTDAGNTTTAETDLYTDTLPASALGTNGDKVTAEYAGIYVTSVTASRQLRVYFGGTLIFDSTALTSAVVDQWNVRVSLIRVSASVVRCTVVFTEHNTTITSSFSSCVYTEVTGLTLTNTQILKITGTAAGAGAATNDIIAKLGTVRWESAA